MSIATGSRNRIDASDPRKLEPAVLDGEVTCLPEQFVAVTDPDDESVDAGEHRVDPVQTLDPDLRLLALGDLVLQACSMAPHFRVQGAVFVDAADLRGKDRQQPLILFVERLRAQLVAEADPSVDGLQRCHGRGDTRANPWKARWKARGDCVASRIGEAAGA